MPKTDEHLEDIEHVVLVDEQDKDLGLAEKAPIHTADTPLHRAFSSFLFNSKGELLLQQRAHHKKPGRAYGVTPPVATHSGAKATKQQYSAV